MLANLEVIDSEDVIKEVKKHPCLYDVTCDDHRNKMLRCEAWLSVFKGLAGASWDHISETEQILFGKEVQKRWKSLKDAFARTVRLQDGRPGIPISKKPYIYHKHLTFMLPFLQTRSSSAGGLFVDSTPSSSTELSSGSTSEDMDPLRLDSNDGQNEPTLRLSQPIGEEILQELREDPGFQRKRRRQSSESAEVNREIASNDPDLMFFYSLIPNMRKLNNTDKMQFQIDVLNKLKETIQLAEMRDIEVSEEMHKIQNRIFKQCGIKVEPSSP